MFKNVQFKNCGHRPPSRRALFYGCRIPGENGTLPEGYLIQDQRTITFTEGNPSTFTT